MPRLVKYRSNLVPRLVKCPGALHLKNCVFPHRRFFSGDMSVKMLEYIRGDLGAGSMETSPSTIPLAGPARLGRFLSYLWVFPLSLRTARLRCRKVPPFRTNWHTSRRRPTPPPPWARARTRGKLQQKHKKCHYHGASWDAECVNNTKKCLEDRSGGIMLG